MYYKVFIGGGDIQKPMMIWLFCPKVIVVSLLRFSPIVESRVCRVVLIYVEVKLFLTIVVKVVVKVKIVAKIVVRVKVKIKVIENIKIKKKRKASI